MARRSRVIAVIVLLCAGSPASAQDEPMLSPTPSPAPAPAPPPAPDREAPPPAPVAAPAPAPALVAAAAAEGPANGFLVQGNIAANLMLPTVYGSFSIMPALRLGAQLRWLAVALELNYTSFTTKHDGGSDSGYHVIAVGPSLQPIIWRSADDHARLCVVAGFNVGGVVAASSYGSTSNDKTWVTGGLNVGVLANYFMHRNFAMGVEGGVRAQFIDFDSELTSVASIYVALSFSLVAAR